MNIKLKSNKVWSNTPENKMEAIAELKKQSMMPSSEQKPDLVFSCIRHLLGYTQEELARFLSVSPKTISRWETGENKPELDFEQFHLLAYELKKNKFDLLAYNCYTLRLTPSQVKIINSWSFGTN